MSTDKYVASLLAPHLVMARDTLLVVWPRLPHACFFPFFTVVWAPPPFIGIKIKPPLCIPPLVLLASALIFISKGQEPGCKNQKE